MAIDILDILSPRRPFVFPTLTPRTITLTGSVGNSLTLTGSYTMAVQKTLTVFRGETVTITDTITGVDITGWDVAFIVRPKAGDPDEARITKSVDSGITLTTPGSGILTITLTADDTDFDHGAYDYTVARRDGGSEVVLSYGSFVVRKNTVLGTRE